MGLIGYDGEFSDEWESVEWRGLWTEVGYRWRWCNMLEAHVAFVAGAEEEDTVRFQSNGPDVETSKTQGTVGALITLGYAF